MSEEKFFGIFIVPALIIIFILMIFAERKYKRKFGAASEQINKKMVQFLSISAMIFGLYSAFVFKIIDDGPWHYLIIMPVVVVIYILISNDAMYLIKYLFRKIKSIKRNQ